MLGRDLILWSLISIPIMVQSRSRGFYVESTGLQLLRRQSLQAERPIDTPFTPRIEHASLAVHRDLSMMKGLVSHPLPALTALSSLGASDSHTFGLILLCSFFVVAGLILGSGGMVLLISRCGASNILRADASQLEIFHACASENVKGHPGCTRIVRSRRKCPSDSVDQHVTQAI